MKVKELIEELKEYDEDLEVVIWQGHDCGWDGYDEGYERVDGTTIVSSYNNKTKAVYISSEPGFLCQFD